VAINDAEISRKHSRLSFQGGKYVLEDLGSTNGTFVNGQRLSGPVVLKPGDVVSLGEQIVLMYDAINMDPGATMASSRKAVQAAMPPPPIQSPVYSSPQGSPIAPVKKTNTTPIFIAVGVFLFICLCITVFLIVDADPTGARWCTFPFSIIAQMMGSSCP
jgi:hypothetical protein